MVFLYFWRKCTSTTFYLFPFVFHRSLPSHWIATQLFPRVYFSLVFSRWGKDFLLNSSFRSFQLDSNSKLEIRWIWCGIFRVRFFLPPIRYLLGCGPVTFVNRQLIKFSGIKSRYNCQTVNCSLSNFNHSPLFYLISQMFWSMFTHKL